MKFMMPTGIYVNDRDLDCIKPPGIGGRTPKNFYFYDKEFCFAFYLSYFPNSEKKSDFKDNQNNRNRKLFFFFLKIIQGLL